MMFRIFRFVLILLLLAGAVYGIYYWKNSGAPAPSLMTTKVLAVYPHDAASFTQGLILHAGLLYESTGRYARSGIRVVDLQSGKVLRKTNNHPDYFGEGLERIGRRLVQLTWKERLAFSYDIETLQPGGRYQYEGQGWGLCFDGTNLIRSDGTGTLIFHDPETFRVRDRISIRAPEGLDLRLNELEFANGSVYANVFPSEKIVRIDLQRKLVTEIIEASQLLDPDERAQADVLNGIAFDPERKSFYLTGKLWPKLFEVTFVKGN